jgi:hypothetical protein
VKVRKNDSVGGIAFVFVCFRSSPSAVDQCRTKRFDENDSGKLFADRQARVANLAYEIGLAGQQPDNLVFAKTKLAKAVLHFWRRTKLFNADSDARADVAEGAHFTTSLFFRAWLDRIRPVHICDMTIAVATDSHYTAFAIS